MKKSILTLFLMTSAAAFANEAGDELANRSPSAQGDRTRAEVQAEVLNARQAGTLGFSEYQAHQQPAIAGTPRSRAEAHAEAKQAARTRVIHELM